MSQVSCRSSGKPVQQLSQGHQYPSQSNDSLPVVHQFLSQVKTQVMTKALLTCFRFGIYSAQYNHQYRFPQHTLALLLSLTTVFPMKLIYFLICKLKIAIASCALFDLEKSLTCAASLIQNSVKPFGFFMALTNICVRVYSSSSICHSLGLYRAVVREH